MKLSKVLNAYPSIGRLVAMKLPVKQAYQVYKLAKKAEENYSFATEQEKKLLTENGAVFSEDNSFTLPQDKWDEVNEKRAEILQLDIDWDADVINIPLDAIEGQDMAASDIYALEEFVNFE